MKSLLNSQKFSFILVLGFAIFSSCQTTTQEALAVIEEPIVQKVKEKKVFIELISNTNIPIAGTEFKKPIVVSVKDNENNPCPNHDLLVTYPISKENNEQKFATKEIQTDENGKASFTPDTILTSINSKVTFTPKINNSYKSQNAKELTISVPLKVKFSLVKKGIMINLVDYNEKDKMDLNSALSTSSNLVGEFWRAGYTSAQNADFHNVIDKGSQAVSQSAKNLVQGSTYFKYIIYGKVKYASLIEEVEGGFSLTLTGTATVLNFADGNEIVTIEKTTTVVDKNKWNVLKACQVQLAKDLADELIYEM